MSTSLHLFGEFDGMTVESVEGTIYVRTRRHDCVSLTLDDAGLDQLQAAIDAARSQLQVGVAA